MRFSVFAATFLASATAVLAGESTIYVTDEVTITSCHSRCRLNGKPAGPAHAWASQRHTLWICGRASMFLLQPSADLATASRPTPGEVRVTFADELQRIPFLALRPERERARILTSHIVTGAETGARCDVAIARLTGASRNAVALYRSETLIGSFQRVDSGTES